LRTAEINKIKCQSRMGNQSAECGKWEIRTFEDGLVGLRPERGHAGEEDVQNDPRTPDIGFTRVVSSKHLGRDVVRAAHDITEPLAWFEIGTQPEIDGHDGRVLVLRREHEVFGFQIPVHHPQTVAMRDGPYHDPEHLRCVFFRVVPAFHDAVEQLAPRTVIHHDVHVLRSFVRREQTHDVGVPGKVVQNRNLPPHVLHVIRSRELALRNRFACSLRAGALVRDQKRRAELPFAENLAVEMGKTEEGGKREGGSEVVHRGRGGHTPWVVALITARCAACVGTLDGDARLRL
jgi:hypothetical protein